MNSPKLFALLSIIIWSFGPALGKFISLKTQFLLTGVAYFFAFLVLITYHYLQDKEAFFQKLRQTKVAYFLIGLFGYSIFSLSFIQTFRAFDSASEPTILNYTWPIFTVLFTEILFRIKKKTKVVYLIEWFGVLIGFFSIILLITRGDLSSLQITNLNGLFWGLLTGSSYGFFSAYSGTVPKARQATFLLSAIFASLLVTISLSLSELSVLPTLTIRDFMIAATLGVFVNGVAYITWTKASRLLREKKESISSIAGMTFFLPLFSLLNIAFIFKEQTLWNPIFLFVILLLICSSILCQKAEVIEKYIRKKI